MAITFLPANSPKIKAPLCPSTVDTGKLGMSLYSISNSIFISLVSPPSPVPKIIPISGLNSNFDLINQNGENITQADYKDKIYVADFFFTSCTTICPIMTDHMYEIQKEILNDDDVMLLSHSVTPKIDSVAQLKRYAKQKGVNDSKWNLVTGDKKHIYDLARKSYLAVKDFGNGDAYDMIHTENFMLNDKKRQIRGFYDGTNPEDITTLLEDIKALKKEYE